MSKEDRRKSKILDFFNRKFNVIRCNIKCYRSNYILTHLNLKFIAGNSSNICMLKATFPVLEGDPA